MTDHHPMGRSRNRKKGAWGSRGSRRTTPDIKTSERGGTPQPVMQSRRRAFNVPMVVPIPLPVLVSRPVAPSTSAASARADHQDHERERDHPHTPRKIRKHSKLPPGWTPRRSPRKTTEPPPDVPLPALFSQPPPTHEYAQMPTPVLSTTLFSSSSGSSSSASTLMPPTPPAGAWVSSSFRGSVFDLNTPSDPCGSGCAVQEPPLSNEDVLFNIFEAPLSPMTTASGATSEDESGAKARVEGSFRAGAGKGGGVSTCRSISTNTHTHTDTTTTTTNDTTNTSSSSTDNAPKPRRVRVPFGRIYAEEARPAPPRLTQAEITSTFLQRLMRERQMMMMNVSMGMITEAASDDGYGDDEDVDFGDGRSTQMDVEDDYMNTMEDIEEELPKQMLGPEGTLVINEGYEALHQPGSIAEIPEHWKVRWSRFERESEAPTDIEDN